MFKPSSSCAAIENGTPRGHSARRAHRASTCPTATWEAAELLGDLRGRGSTRCATRSTCRSTSPPSASSWRWGRSKPSTPRTASASRGPRERVFAAHSAFPEVTATRAHQRLRHYAAGGMRGELVLIQKVVGSRGPRARGKQDLLPRRSRDLKANTRSRARWRARTGLRCARARSASTEPRRAGKTGTTDLQRTDAWFVGLHPDLAVGVWSGSTKRKPWAKRDDGRFVSLPTWTAVSESTSNTGDQPRPCLRRAPKASCTVVICEKSGLLGHRCLVPLIRREVFIEGTEPQRTCDRHGSARSSRPLQDHGRRRRARPRNPHNND